MEGPPSQRADWAEEGAEAGADAPPHRRMAPERCASQVAARGWLPRGGAALLGVLVLLALPGPSNGQMGGTYRYGTVSWESRGNVVDFTIETAFKRSLSFFEGHAPDGLLAIGDNTTLQGREAPQFLYGDSQVATSLKMQVTAMSLAEDWVLGVVRLRHTYGTPNDAARPWKAQYVGCCRLAGLKNAAGLNWAIAAEVDLTRATRSPKATTLPVVSVPLRAMHSASHLPGVFLPTRGAADGAEWGVGKPFDVGTAVLLNQSLGSSFLSVPLARLATGGGCDSSSVSQACFVSLLRASPALPGYALTVEGWFKPGSTTGGYLLHVGRSMGADAVGCPATLATSAQVDACALSTLFIKVAPDGAGILLTVGHESVGVSSPTASEWVRTYPISPDHAGKWMHVAVVRSDHADCFDANIGVCDTGVRRVAYTVYLMGKELIPTGTDQSLASAPRQCLCAPSWRTLTPATTLRFGAGVSNSGAVTGAFHGYLDDWRFWNGARAKEQVVAALKMVQPDPEILPKSSLNPP
ncbi:hypothetical protein T484DRAFT_3341748 [Baffinella frigidus]|nr:hypothetical protein T484DRAFT_3341748 [Cryptophyta sp. CCMP2293]